ncbi:putative bifunctional diguanylate cyclase/phosphodiesterase [Mobilicoccus pelagius]|uniref:Signaling protein n=1 Tax=Mobilicoccus pelagius NBRC 104925 TaxID=1089455 RepID=H5UNH3_9MICO|nr:bifunctional diguanylate cyclase/phosphodiesterase [Mobilicoccus pelagius]GAB47281.1 hypothetical protein MOPEL_007_00970 [Mobilicoccus pelagius NBRC 104925]
MELRESPRARTPGVNAIRIAVPVCVTGLTSWAYARDPAGWGAALLTLTAGGCLVVVGVWPHVLGARPRRIWGLLTLSQALFLPAVVAMFVGPESARWSLVSNLLFLVGYIAFMGWLVLLNAGVNGRAVALRSCVDTLAATVGMFLVLWTCAGVVDRDVAGVSAMNVVFPLIDVVAVSQAVYVTMRVEPQLPAWRWVLGAVSFQTFLDAAFFVMEAQGREHGQSWLWLGYMTSYMMLAVAVTHPSVRRSGAVPARPCPGIASGPTRAVFVLLGVVLAIVSLMVPGHTDTYELVRSLLVAVLLLTLFGRVMMSLSQASIAEARSRHRTTHDPVTGLLNRTAFHEAFTRVADRHLAPGLRLAAVVVDVDGFQRFNDTWGHREGDRLLRGLARALDRAFGGDGMVARYGGDEFVVVRTVGDDASVRRLVGRVHEAVATPVPVSSRHVEEISTAAGVAVGEIVPGGGVETVLQQADAALVEAKSRAKDRCVVYDDELDARLRHRSAMAEALRAAIAEDRLSVAFQPIHTGPRFSRLRGWEALARWEDPELGVLTPAEFVPLAEETGLICDLGDTILRRALAEFALLRARLGDDVSVSINVSPAQLHQTGFRASVLEAVSVCGVPASAVQLEITESLLVDEDSPPIATLEAFRADGFGLALDDFGTGYASFTTLRRLPLSCVKIDRSLVSRLGEDRDAAGQIRAVLHLVRSFHIGGIVAEGVETEEQAELLAQLGCPAVQGWLFGRPTPAAQILAAADAEAQGIASVRAVAGVTAGKDAVTATGRRGD